MNTKTTHLQAVRSVSSRWMAAAFLFLAFTEFAPVGQTPNIPVKTLASGQAGHP